MGLDSPSPEAHVETAALVVPVSGATVGGDFHTIEEIGTRTVAVVGDVEGNGEDAAPYAAALCAELTEHIADEQEPAELLEHLNGRAYGDPEFERLATACAVTIDRASWSARWAFAGHLPPHWLDSGLPIDGATPGLPLGYARACGAVSAGRRPLRPGEGMLLFTDGLEDVAGAGGDRFGSARVTHTLARSLYGAGPSEIVSRLKAIACEFGSQKLNDDMCLLALRVS
jgi:serine phosphatase RsbU (regulator of sigma subunit)